jgi:hypothetical protein
MCVIAAAATPIGSWRISKIATIGSLPLCT